MGDSGAPTGNNLELGGEPVALPKRPNPAANEIPTSLFLLSRAYEMIE
jgi:hypothetical protein